MDGNLEDMSTAIRVVLEEARWYENARDFLAYLMGGLYEERLLSLLSLLKEGGRVGREVAKKA